MRIRAFGALALAASLIPVAGCGSSTPLANTLPAPTPTSITDTLTGTLTCCFNSDFKTFTVAQSGNIDFTLTSLIVNGSPSTISMSLGIGTPTGTSCLLLTNGSITGPAGASGTLGIAELSGGPIAAGTYCLQLTDVGNVPANATVNYTITVAHT